MRKLLLTTASLLMSHTAMAALDFGYPGWDSLRAVDTKVEASCVRLSRNDSHSLFLQNTCLNMVQLAKNDIREYWYRVSASNREDCMQSTADTIERERAGAYQHYYFYLNACLLKKPRLTDDSLYHLY